MYRALPRMGEPGQELRRRLRQARHAEQKRRLHLLVWVAEGRVSTPQEAAEPLALHRNTLGHWLSRYEQTGVEGLLRAATRGAPAAQRTLWAAAFQALHARLQAPSGLGSYGEIQQWLAQEWGEELDYQAVHRRVYRRLKAKLKRPRHPPKTRPRPPSWRSACSVA